MFSQSIGMTEQGLGTTFKNGTLKIETLKRISEYLEIPIAVFFPDEDSKSDISVFLNYFKLSGSTFQFNYYYLKNIYVRIIFEENNTAKFLLDSFLGLDEEILANIEIENYSRTHQKGPYRFVKGTKKKPGIFELIEPETKPRFAFTEDYFINSLTPRGLGILGISKIPYDLLPINTLKNIENYYNKLIQSFFDNVSHDPLFEILVKNEIMNISNIFMLCNDFLTQERELKVPSSILKRKYTKDDNTKNDI